MSNWGIRHQRAGELSGGAGSELPFRRGQLYAAPARDAFWGSAWKAAALPTELLPHDRVTCRAPRRRSAQPTSCPRRARTARREGEQARSLPPAIRFAGAAARRCPSNLSFLRARHQVLRRRSVLQERETIGPTFFARNRIGQTFGPQRRHGRRDPRRRDQGFRCLAASATFAGDGAPAPSNGYAHGGPR